MLEGLKPQSRGQGSTVSFWAVNAGWLWPSSELIRGHTSPEAFLGVQTSCTAGSSGVSCNTCLYGHGSLEAPLQCRQAHVVLQSSSVLVEQMSIPETKVICSPELKQIVSLDSCPRPPPAPAMAGLERWLSTT